MEISKRPNLIALIYYKKKNNWRGFCVPYDIDCEGKTVKEANNKLRQLVDFYEEGLQKYNYPSHLTIKDISDPQDKKVFDKIIKKLFSNSNQFIKFQRKQNLTCSESGLKGIIEPCNYSNIHKDQAFA